MNNPSENIDDKIREALRNEDSQLLAQFQNELSLQEMVIETFHGRHRWLVVMVFVCLAIFAGLLVFCGYQFFHAETTRHQIIWATAFLWLFSWTAMLKIWYWLELNKNSVTREVKRLELQVAKLSQQLEQE